MNNVTLIEVTSETTVCECCGKVDLKRVAVLNVNGKVVRYGRDCAARALGKSVAKNIDLFVETQQKIEKSIALIEKFASEYPLQTISNKINLTVNCQLSGNVFTVGYKGIKMVQYTPEIYRSQVSWWAA